ncbi:MAG TPA: hypothetical protein VIG33_06080 [Pseudobdellovibrionaceae bacterium]|jgi:hypothetical protein
MRISKLKSAFLLILLSLFIQSTLLPAAAATASVCRSVFAYQSTQAEWQRLSQEERYSRRKAEMHTPSRQGVIERRPIIKTSGLRKDAVPDIDPADIKVDTADPSLVMPITYPNGQTKYRINFSGLRFIEADSPADLYKPGIRKVRHSRGFYKDGTEMTGAYHNEAWPWDVVIYKNDAGKWIALGGVMEQAVPGKLPNVRENNRTRSRWWGKVSHVQIKPGVYEEHIVWQGPIHDFNISKHQGWKYHGYGGTLVTQFNPKTGMHEPIKNKRGNYILMYERVIEERNGMPWMTSTFMRDMDPSLTHTVGPEIEVTNIISPVTGQIFEAFRRGDEKETTGYLREGDNVLKEKEHNQYIKAGSGNDYVRKYGIYLDYRDPGRDAQGLFKNVIDEKGQLIDFASTLKLREIFNGTWVGRPQLSYDPQGKLWLAFHFVPKDSIPPGGPQEGWPSAEDFPKYARIMAMFPVKFEYDKSRQPLLVKDIDPKYAYKYE